MRSAGRMEKKSRSRGGAHDRLPRSGFGSPVPEPRLYRVAEWCPGHQVRESPGTTPRCSHLPSF